MTVVANYGLLKNMRMDVLGRIFTRPGMAALSSVAFDETLVHSIRRLNDDFASTFARICGAGTKLYLNPGVGSLITGFSGNPLSLIPFRPERSPQAWMYVADSLKMAKVRADGLAHGVGIAPPLTAPTAALGAPTYQTISDFEAVGAWTNGGTAGAISAVTRISTTIARILFDSGSTGWATIEPTAMSDQFQTGMLIIVNSGGGTQETVLVDSIIQPLAATTISSIAYDSGSTGLCTIQPTIGTLVRSLVGYDPTMDEVDDAGLVDEGGRVNKAAATALARNRRLVRSQTTLPLGLQPNAMIRLNPGGGNDEVVRVLSVSIGPDGSASFRCSTVNTHVAGEAIQGQRVFRAYCVNTHAAAETLGSNCFQSSVTVGTGYISLVSAFNLSTTGSRPIQEDDEFHISIRFDAPQNLSELRVMLDVDGSTNDFTRNYFFRAVRQNDLQQAVVSNVPVVVARQAGVSRTVIDTFGSDLLGSDVGPIMRFPRSNFFDVAAPADVPFTPGGNLPTSEQANTGSTQWTELVFKVKDLTRVGADISRGLANVAAIRIQAIVSATTVMNVDAFWVGGSYGPDIGTLGAPYLYRYRGRSKVTGVIGNPSPAMRSGIEPHRQRVVVTLTQHPSSDVDTLDVFRWGGDLPQWTLAGWTANSATPSFNDDFADDDIASAPLLDFDNFQPFPTIDTPKSGVVNVKGTTVERVSGDNFNTAWAPGTQINIGGQFYTLYAQPSSTSRLEIVENGGTQASATWFIYQATILGQPLAAMWGPYTDAGPAYMFACGDSYQPGVLFVTKGNNPDSAPDNLQIEITSPSEPLMNGCVFDSTPYVWSNKKRYRGYPGSSTNLFTFRDVEGSRGLFSRWGFCCGPRIWTLSDDGIYESSGGADQSITAEQLWMLFPHEGQAGVPITMGSETVYPPDLTHPEALRLSYAANHLYFDFLDTQGNYRTLVYSILWKTWSLDAYAPTVLIHYGEEGRGLNSLLLGANDGRVYQASGTQDAGVDFAWKIQMPLLMELLGSNSHARDGYLGLQSNAAATLIMNVEGTDYTVVVPSTSGLYARPYVVLPAVKGDLFAFGLSGSGACTLFPRDCEFDMGAWNRMTQYTQVNPFSALTRAQTARVS